MARVQIRLNNFPIFDIYLYYLCAKVVRSVCSARTPFCIVFRTDESVADNTEINKEEEGLASLLEEMVILVGPVEDLV